MLRQLPDKTEVADLLVDVSQTGLAAGLEFELFNPQNEIPKDFYAELPISIRVIGNYHEFGNFVSGVAALPRIVTVSDITIAPKKAKDGDGLLAMNLTAKTYRYMDEDERSAADEETPKKGKKGKKGNKK
jgi:type IV pilus assembly protein PilO